MSNFNFCKNKMRLDKVTCYIQPFSVSFFKLFTTVAITFHSITSLENTSLDVTGSLGCKQTAIVSYFMYIFIFCVLECFFVDVINLSGKVNYKISLDKIVDIFPNKNACLKRKCSQIVFSCIYQHLYIFQCF